MRLVACTWERRVEEDSLARVLPDGSADLVWTDEGEVFVRSYKGDRGHWYQAALDKPRDVALEVDGQTIPVQALVAIDEESIERCSRGLKAKYRKSRSFDSMLLPFTLETTLRLEPR